MPSITQAEKSLIDSRKELAGYGNDSAAQKASSMMFKSFEDSLKLYMSSVKYQDPMNPVDTKEMAAQMFQLSQAQGLHSMNQSMERQLELMKTSQVLSTTGLIGKVVELDTDKFSLDKGRPVDMSFTLPRDVAKAKVEILDQKGAVLFGKDLMPNPGHKVLPAGLQRVQWEGDVNTSHGVAIAKGNKLQDGTYRIKVTLFNAKGEKIKDPYTDEPIVLPTTVKSRLIGSDFSQKVPKLLVGQDLSLPLSSIVSIQEDMPEGENMVDRVNELNQIMEDLEQADQEEANEEIKRLAKTTRKEVKKAEKFERRVNNLTPRQFEQLKTQLEQKIAQGE